MRSYMAHAPGASNTSGYKAFPRDPSFEGIKYAKEIFSGDGVYVDGACAVLTFPVLTALELDTLLLQDGFTSETVRSVSLTVRLPNQGWSAGIDYNCTAARPRWGSNGGFRQLYYYDVVYRLYKLVAF